MDLLGRIAYQQLEKSEQTYLQRLRASASQLLVPMFCWSLVIGLPFACVKLVIEQGSGQYAFAGLLLTDLVRTAILIPAYCWLIAEWQTQRRLPALGEALAFARRRFWLVFQVQVEVSIRVILWSFLLIVPGITRSLAYSLAPLLAASRDDLDSPAAIQMSTRLMRGNRWRLFVIYGALGLITLLPWGGIIALSGAEITAQWMGWPWFLLQLIAMPLTFLALTVFFASLRRPKAETAVAATSLD